MRSVKIFGGVLVSLGIVLGACTPTASGGEGFPSDVSTVEVVSTNVGGKNVFIPSTIVIVSGKPHTLSLYNTTDTPHGFKIEGLGVETVLMSKQEQQVELPALDAAGVYRIHCHLHPPHRSATLVVLPGQ